MLYVIGVKLATDNELKKTSWGGSAPLSLLNKAMLPSALLGVPPSVPLTVLVSSSGTNDRQRIKLSFVPSAKIRCMPEYVNGTRLSYAPAASTTV